MLPLYALIGSLAGIAASLNSLQWLLPNTSGDLGGYASCPASASASAVMGGAPGTSYDVMLRFVGDVEAKSYSGGSDDGAYWQIGGAPVSDLWNIYQLTISSPAQTYYLNKGTSGAFVTHAIDYTKTIQIDAGATVSLFASSEGGEEIVNTIGSVPGVTNPAQPYAGQFINMIVVSVSPH